MNFVNPGALWAFLPLGGVIVFFYMLRMRRRDFRVPAVFLWPQKTEEVRANAFIQRPRFSWLMVLQLLAMALMILGLARPQQRQSGLAGGVTVFVLDASASMGATDEKPTRFNRARSLVEAAIRTMKAGERIALIEAGPEPRVVFPLQNDPSRQLAALGGVERSDAEVELGPGLRLAAALVGAQPKARIVLLSDGSGEPVRDFSAGKAEFVFQSIGRDNANVRISALGVTDTPKRRLAYVEAQNTGGRAMEGKMTVFADDKVVDSDTFSILSGRSWGKTISVPRNAAVLMATIEVEDLLAADNERFALIQPGSTLRVLLVGPGDIFLERALSLDPRVTLDRAKAVPTAELGKRGASGGSYDVIVFDGVPELPVKAPGVLNFGGAGSPWVKIRGSARSAQAGLSEKTPLMSGVDLDGIYFGKSAQMAPVGSAATAVESEEGALIVQAPGAVVTAFTPLESDFPLQIAFPIFVANALDAVAQTANSNIRAIRPGQVFSVSSATPLKLISPNGRTTTIPMSDGTALVRGIKWVGRYSLDGGGRSQTLLVSLQSEFESQITPQVTFQTTGGKIAAAKAPDRFVDFVTPLIALLLLLLGCEWWLFVRKS